MSQPPKKLLDQLGDRIQLKHYSSRTEEAYVCWVSELILSQKAEASSFRHPEEMGMSEVNLLFLDFERF